MALRMLAISVLPLSSDAETHSWSNLQQAVVQLLLTQALPAAMPSALAAWQASLGSGAVNQLETLSHSTAGDQATYCKAYSAAAHAVWSNSGVWQLIQLLAAMSLGSDTLTQELGLVRCSQQWQLLMLMRLSLAPAVCSSAAHA